MDKPKDIKPSHSGLGTRISRRVLIGMSVVGAASTIEATWPRRQAPTPIEKASKKVAGYYEKPRDSAQNCSSCHFFLPPDVCAIVEGPVTPWGYCNYYAD